MSDQGLGESFRSAFSGLANALRGQRSLRLQLVAAAAVIALGAWLDLPAVDWAVLTLTIGFVLVSEMFNTAAEALVDLISPEYRPLAGVVKDVSAGAVLLVSVLSVIVGLLVLGPPLCVRLFGVP